MGRPSLDTLRPRSPNAFTSGIPINVPIGGQMGGDVRRGWGCTSTISDLLPSFEATMSPSSDSFVPCTISWRRSGFTVRRSSSKKLLSNGSLGRRESSRSGWAGKPLQGHGLAWQRYSVNTLASRSPRSWWGRDQMGSRSLEPARSAAAPLSKGTSLPRSNEAERMLYRAPYEGAPGSSPPWSFRANSRMSFR